MFIISCSIHFLYFKNMKESCRRNTKTTCSRDLGVTMYKQISALSAVSSPFPLQSGMLMKQAGVKLEENRTGTD